MYFGKISIILLVVSCVVINAQRSSKRKLTKSKAKTRRSGLQNLGLSGCGCQNTLIDILNCGCRGPVIEPVYASVALHNPGPVIDVPNYRFAEPMELNPLGCLFPTLDITSFEILASPITVPTIEIVTPVLDAPCGCAKPCGCSKSCGCASPKCGCNRSPAVKLPVTPYGSVAAIDAKCGCQSLLPAYSYGISSVIELPSYGPVTCGCQGPCSCAGLPVSSCDCLGPCSCSSILPSCGCSGPCSCSNLPVTVCECMGPCSCAAVSSCGCNGPCGCSGIPVAACGCNSPCSCSSLPISSCGSPLSILSCGCSGSCSCSALPPCGCSGPCSCPSLPISCGCSGPCGCLGIQMPMLGCQLPAIEVPSCGCGCGVPGCGCNPKYLRQVTLQPPFL